MPGPYTRLDVANVNQHVVTAPPESKKAAKKATKSDDKDAAASESDKAS